MNTTEKIALLRQRFVHRSDAFVRQWYEEETDKGGYVTAVEGTCTFGCTRRVCPHVTRLSLEDKHIVAHLRGEQTIGIYQLDEANTVKWICFDVDADNEEGYPFIAEHTRDVARAVYSHVGPQFLVEWSGNRGYHVWIFFSAPIEASKAQAFGRAVEQLAGQKPNVHVEVFPKQTEIKNFGNLVKLPLGVHRKTGSRSVFINNRFEAYPLDEQFQRLSTVPLVAPAELDEMIQEGRIAVKEANGTSKHDAQRGYLTLPCMARIMDEGVTEGARDIATFRLACYLRDRSLNELMASAAMDAWNSELNRPPLDAAQLESKIASAYSDSYSPVPCGEQIIDQYCSSSCRLWNNKVRERWTRFKKPPLEAIGVISRD